MKKGRKAKGLIEDCRAAEGYIFGEFGFFIAGENYFIKRGGEKEAFSFLPKGYLNGVHGQTDFRAGRREQNCLSCLKTRINDYKLLHPIPG